MKRFYFLVLVACTLLVSCGNDEGFTSSPVPSASLTVINGITDSPDLTALSNNLSIGTIGFGQATRATAVLPQIPIDFMASFFNNGVEQVVNNTIVELNISASQTLVLTGTLDNPSTISVIDEPFEFTAGTTDTRIRFINATSNVASATVALTNPNGSNQTIAMTNGQPTGFTTTTAGASVQMTVTDTSSNAVLWQSGEFFLSAGGSRTFTLLDYFGPGTGAVRMASFNDPSGTTLFVNEQLPSAVRITNQTANRGDLDFYSDTTLLATLGFNGVSDYIAITPGVSTFRITPAGDNNTELLSSERTLFLGTFNTLQVAAVGDLTPIGTALSVDERRPIATQSVLNINKLAPAVALVDLYFQNQGEGLVGNPDLLQLADFVPGTLNVTPQAYDLYVVETGTTNILVGPTTLTLESGGIYTVQITDSAGGGTPLELQLLDDFQP